MNHSTVQHTANNKVNHKFALSMADADPLLETRSEMIFKSSLDCAN